MTRLQKNANGTTRPASIQVIQSRSTPASKSNGSSSKPMQFSLPTLEPLESLTKGTDIPPPPDSPIKTELKPLEEEKEKGKVEAPEDSSKTTPPLSPSGRKQQQQTGGIRRLLSIRSLSSSYHSDEDSKDGATDSIDSTMLGSSKRNSRWFWRSKPKKADVAAKAPAVKETPKPKGPPPPTLPELKKPETEFEDDLFKDIR